MTTLDVLSQNMAADHKITNSWRKTGAKWGLNPAMARLIAGGYNPGKTIRKRLGLPEMAQVVGIDGEAPAGAQVPAASQCQCAEWFVSDNPRRNRCYICAPRRKRRKPARPESVPQSIRVGRVTQPERAAILGLSPTERREALLGAARWECT